MSALQLLTADLRELLLANGREPGQDHVPLVTELDSDGDTLFGLADLGMGCPELGSFSLAELAALRLPFGLRIERDLFFSTDRPLSVWADAARNAGSIAGAERLLATVRS